MYILKVTEEQAKSGVTVKGAAIIMRENLNKLIIIMASWLFDPALSTDEQFELLRDIAFICLAFAAGKRCHDLTNLLIA